MLKKTKSQDNFPKVIQIEPIKAKHSDKKSSTGKNNDLSVGTSDHENCEYQKNTNKTSTPQHRNKGSFFPKNIEEITVNEIKSDTEIKQKCQKKSSLRHVSSMDTNESRLKPQLRFELKA